MARKERQRAVRVPHKIDRIGVCLSELGNVYRSLKREEITPDQGRALVGTLGVIRDTIELMDLVKRIEALEGGGTEAAKALPAPSEAIDAEVVEVPR